jgi:hypothetical protein
MPARFNPARWFRQRLFRSHKRKGTLEEMVPVLLIASKAQAYALLIISSPSMSLPHQPD